MGSGSGSTVREGTGETRISMEFCYSRDWEAVEGTLVSQGKRKACASSKRRRELTCRPVCEQSRSRILPPKSHVRIQLPRRARNRLKLPLDLVRSFRYGVTRHSKARSVIPRDSFEMRFPFKISSFIRILHHPNTNTISSPLLRELGICPCWKIQRRQERIP